MVVKWFIRETNSAEALEVRDRHVNGAFTLAAPAILPFEALNALRYSSLYTEAELKEAADSLSSYGLSLYQLEGDYADLSVEAAHANNITIYDSSYVALAMKLNTKLLTADRQLLRKLKGKYARVAVDISIPTERLWGLAAGTRDKNPKKTARQAISTRALPSKRRRSR